jgi:hypothetical protein
MASFFLRGGTALGQGKRGACELAAVICLGSQFDGDDRTLTTPSPGRNSGARNPDVLGQASGTGPDHLIPNTVIVRLARPRVCGGDVYHHESIASLSPAKKLNDIRAVEVAYTKVLNVCAHSRVPRSRFSYFAKRMIAAGLVLPQYSAVASW